MNKARKEMILAIWEQYEAGRGALDREFVVRSQELVVAWAEENGVDLNEPSDLETLHEKLQADEDMMKKSEELANETQARFQSLLFDQLIPAIDRTKVDCKDGIITPDDVRAESGGIIVTGG